MANPVGHELAYLDELGSAYTHGTGAGSTKRVALAGGLSAIYGLCFAPGDYTDVLFQFNHDVHVPLTGNVTLDLHVHWSTVAAPAAGATVIWELDVIGAKPTLVTTGKGSAAQYAASVTTLVSPTFVSDGTEVRHHFLSDMGDLSIPVADWGPSYCLWGTFRLKATSTVAADKVCLQWLDWHKRVGSFGTATEYV